MTKRINLKLEMVRQDMTQTALADKINIPRVTLNLIINGRLVPKLEEKTKIAQGLNVAVNDIFEV